MFRHIFLASFLFFVSFSGSWAQSFWFGPQGGLSLGTQTGNNNGRGPLFGGHVGFFIETLDEDKSFGSLYARMGLHQRGSSSRAFFNSNFVNIPAINYVYNNVVLQLGAKKFYNDKFYYTVGVRGEYSAFTNLEKLAMEFNSLFFPLQEFVQPFTGGISGGAGYQFELGELYGVSAEFSIHPDFFNQYISPDIGNVLNPFNGQPTTIRAMEIRNTAVELTVAMRFLRKVEYID